MGFKDGEGPYFERPIRSVAEIERLAAPDPAQELRYVTEPTVEGLRAAFASRPRGTPSRTP